MKNIVICSFLMYLVKYNNCLLQFTTKQLERYAKKSEKEEKVQQGKIKKVKQAYLGELYIDCTCF